MWSGGRPVTPTPRRASRARPSVRPSPGRRRTRRSRRIRSASGAAKGICADHVARNPPSSEPVGAFHGSHDKGRHLPRIHVPPHRTLRLPRSDPLQPLVASQTATAAGLDFVRPPRLDTKRTSRERVRRQPEEGHMLAERDAAATIAVKDLDRAKTFYEGTLGLKPSGGQDSEVRVYQSGNSKIVVYKSQYAGTNQA